jgi:hypothetical protein
MAIVLAILALGWQSAPQPPLRVDPNAPAADRAIYRDVKAGEVRVEGLLQRVDCPAGRAVTFIMKVKGGVAKYQAPRLDAVDYIAHTPTFRGPMSCGGRMPGDPVYLTWKTENGAPRVVAVEFLPKK